MYMYLNQDEVALFALLEDMLAECIHVAETQDKVPVAVKVV